MEIDDAEMAVLETSIEDVAEEMLDAYPALLRAPMRLTSIVMGITLMTMFKRMMANGMTVEQIAEVARRKSCDAQAEKH